MMRQGKVKWFNNAKGYGFIIDSEGDVFVHHTKIIMEGYKTLLEGQKVEYQVFYTEKGLHAGYVKPLSNMEIE